MARCIAHRSIASFISLIASLVARRIAHRSPHCSLLMPHLRSAHRSSDVASLVASLVVRRDRSSHHSSLVASPIARCCPTDHHDPPCQTDLTAPDSGPTVVRYSGPTVSQSDSGPTVVRHTDSGTTVVRHAGPTVVRQFRQWSDSCVPTVVRQFRQPGRAQSRTAWSCHSSKPFSRKATHKSPCRLQRVERFVTELSEPLVQHAMHVSRE